MLDYSKKDNSRQSRVSIELTDGFKIIISSDLGEPDTELGVLIKAVAAQVIFDCSESKKAPNEIWKKVEEAWQVAKENSSEYKIINNSPQSDPAQSL